MDVAEQELKEGKKTLSEALNEPLIRWGNMTNQERDAVRDKLVPRPDRAITKKIEKLIAKYSD